MKAICTVSIIYNDTARNDILGKLVTLGLILCVKSIDFNNVRQNYIVERDNNLVRVCNIHF